jgi:hypothetical protein
MSLGEHKQDARVALALVAGVAAGDRSAEELLVDGFDDLAHAARAHAYLAGFLLQALAASRGESQERSVDWIRSLLT